MVSMAGSRNSSLGRRISRLANKADRRALLAVAAGLLLAAGAAMPALAQGWWPFGGNQQQQRPPPVPREPVYRDPDAVGPPPQAQDAWTGGGAGGRSPICLQLEQRLVQEGQRGSESRTLVPMVENELREADRAHRSVKQQLDRSDCYEYFLFSKTLRRTRRCIDLANQADAAQRRVDDLEVQLQQLQASSGRSYQDEIVRELARNNCGANYQQQARRQGGSFFSNFWEDEESTGYGGGSSFGALPYATYRTVCVRLCDGYYFPVSFSTLPNHFQRDEEICQSKCAAPAALYYHQNPGAGMEQAMAARSNEAYTTLRTAFRYRKEYVQGCSCKVAEYQPPEGSVPQQGAAPGGDAGGWAAEGLTGATGAPPADGQGEELPWSTTP